MPPTSRFAVIGDPIAHSLSPVMQSAAFAAAGIEAEYVREQVSADALGNWVRTAGRRYAGFNVTIPHKESICEYLDRLDSTARSVDAVNTVVQQADGLIGYNTDLAGFRETVRSLHIDPAGLEAVVLGAGGSSRAVVRSLVGLGARVTVCNRNESRAQALLADLGLSLRVLRLSSREARQAIESAGLVINTTPLGMRHLPKSPLPAYTRLNPRTAIVDLVYGTPTPLLQLARETGCTAVDGIEMLVQQGAASFHLWTGLWPNLDVMRLSCRQALLEVCTCSAS